MKYISVAWFSTYSTLVGIVIVLNKDNVYRAFINSVIGQNEQWDIQQICIHGAKLSLSAAFCACQGSPTILDREHWEKLEVIFLSGHFDTTIFKWDATKNEAIKDK